ncbi:hypothetical protein PGT21_007226 [Puccinia graminis f. sp. tritici]|uniref:Uncharacterized protein n=1 Tax=Puccinia graminis f. sp. tritici TaxID=56615 RepID=A0A5B0PTQ0_PUCGR|nr:hypothetical protein PGT21_007226 [Puccinia graminis f. sp. tritici]
MAIPSALLQLPILETAQMGQAKDERLSRMPEKPMEVRLSNMTAAKGYPFLIESSIPPAPADMFFICQRSLMQLEPLLVLVGWTR